MTDTRDKKSQPKAGIAPVEMTATSKLITSTTPKIKRIVIHIGTRKTGSTSFQNKVRNAQRELWPQGVSLVVPRGRNFKELFLNIRSSETFWRHWIEQALLTAHEENCETLLITSEDLYYLPDEKIKELGEFCKTLAKRVEVVVFLRRQDAYLQSAYIQYVTTGIWVGNIQTNFENFWAASRENLNHTKKLAVWETACSPDGLHPVPYVKGNTSDYLLNYLGVIIKDEQVSAPTRNSRKPLDVLRASVYIGEVIATHNARRVHNFSDLNSHFDFRGRIKRALALAFQDADDQIERYDVITTEQMALLGDAYGEANKALLETYGRNISEGFDDFSGQGRHVHDLSINAMAPDSVARVIKVLTEQLSDLGDTRPPKNDAA